MTTRARTGLGDALGEPPWPCGPSWRLGGSWGRRRQPSSRRHPSGMGRVFGSPKADRSATPVPGDLSLGTLLVHRGNLGDPTQTVEEGAVASQAWLW